MKTSEKVLNQYRSHGEIIESIKVDLHPNYVNITKQWEIANHSGCDSMSIKHETARSLRDQLNKVEL